MINLETYKKPNILLTTDNAKTIKGIPFGYTTLILYLSPASQNKMGKNLCAKSSEGCRAACLFTAGKGKFTNVATARLNRTEFFLKDKKNFMLQIAIEIGMAIDKYPYEKLCVRLNGTSDIPFENIPVLGKKNIMELYPEIQFYDYTKVFTRLTNKMPNNYHLTFSRSETAINHAECKLALKLGYNVAAVFNIHDAAELPATYWGYPVINADENDLRFLDKRNCISGLKAKGEAKKDTSNFVITEF